MSCYMIESEICMASCFFFTMMDTVVNPTKGKAMFGSLMYTVTIRILCTIHDLSERNDISMSIITISLALVSREVKWLNHDDVIKWKHFPHYCPFVRGIHRSPVNSPHKGQWRGALMSSLICSWINGWVNNGEAGDLRRHRAHYDVIGMSYHFPLTSSLLWKNMRMIKTSEISVANGVWYNEIQKLSRALMGFAI